MSDLIGIIVPLRKFLSNTDEPIYIPASGQDDFKVLRLSPDRIYKIPDFQREIRWDSDNTELLIEDIASGPKYLGNIILTQHPDGNFSIIDGQQRITVLTLILTCIEHLHGDRISVMHPCNLYIESFSLFSKILAEFFPAEKRAAEDVLSTDKLHQASKYYALWDYICANSSVANRENAKKLLENIEKSTINLIINKSDNIGDSIRYFIDVNLKGKQLDTEDIFKSFLFKNDQSKEIRDAWYALKTTMAAAEASRLHYPLLKLLEHYFYCELYKTQQYKGLEFGDNFLTKKEFRGDQDYRKGTHIVEIIDDKRYMLNTVRTLNQVIQIMLEIVNSNSTTKAFEDLFDGARMDSVEIGVIHNILGKILRDKNNLPKALVMKYILSSLLNKASKPKSECQKIYGVYMLSVLFVIFENKKSKEILMNVLKAPDEKWYEVSVAHIKAYFASDAITDSRILAQYKLTSNEDLDDYRFRCKSIATIYNFFTIDRDAVKIKKRQMKKLHSFLNDDSKYSLEHFVISDSAKRATKIVIAGEEFEYLYDESFFKKYVNNLFNFIFVDQSLNDSLSNYWLPQKMELIKGNDVSCEFSLMVLSKLEPLSNAMYSAATQPGQPKNNIDAFLLREFKDEYIKCAREILSTVLARIKQQL